MRLPRSSFWRLLGVGVLGVLLAVGIGGTLTYHGFRVVVLICALLLVVAGVVLSRSVLRATRAIADVVQRITRGELGARVPAIPGDEINALGRAINAMADQLERRVLEAESQRRQIQAVLDSMVEGVCALDREGRILWLNASAQRLLGVAAQQAAGRRLLELFRQPELDELIQSVLERQQPATREVQVFSPREQVVRFHAAPCGSDEGREPAGAALVLVAQDVTEMRRLERTRREFVGNVSHELKTPLTSIQGLIETLLSGALEDAANNRRFVSLIQEDAVRLSRLIDDLLELSQIESKAAPLKLGCVELQPLIQDAVARLRPRFTERQVACELAIPAGTPPVAADPDRLRQVFLNLLENAAKFNTAGGRVRVTARRQDDATVSVSVEDTGLGIPEEDLPRIFERFYRVDKARSRELGGTGLGLAIVKHLVELHRGGIAVQSRPGHGSTFTVTLPVWPPHQTLER